MESLDEEGGDAAAWRVRVIYALLAAVLFMAMAVIHRESILGDPDIWWHIRTGSWIWQNGALPTTDPFSFSFAGHPWIAKEWLSQLLFFAAHSTAGWNGVMLVTGLATAMAAAALCWSISTWLNPLHALGITVAALLLALATFTARPHMLTLVLAILWTHQLFTASWRGRAPPLVLLLVLVLWANLHAAFTLGFVIAGFAFLDVLERYRLTRPDLLRRWLVFLALCPVVCLIHPYGWNAMLATWSVAGPNEAVAFIEEWQPFNPQERWLQQLALLALLFGALARGFRLGLARALLVVLLLHLAFIHVRFFFVLFTLLPVILTPEIAQQCPALSADTWRAQKRDRLESLLIAVWRPAAGLLGGAVIALASLQALVLATAPPPDVRLEGALAFVDKHRITGPVFNRYRFGGPLIFHGIPTFIDGRTDQLFLDGFAKEFMVGPGTDWQLDEALRKHGITWTLLPPDDARVAALNRLADWQRVYSDSYAVIHVPRGSWKY